MRNTVLVVRPLLLILLGVCLSSIVRAEDTNVVLYRVNKGSTIVLMARLSRCSEACITFSATLENMSSSVSLPQTVEVTGPKSVTLAVFTPINPKAPSHCTGAYTWEYGKRLASAPRAFSYQFPYHSGPYRVLQAAHGAFSHNLGTPDAEAIDWAMPVGTLIYPARAGTVIGYRDDSNVGGPDKKWEEECNYVIVKHDDGTMAEYLHLQRYGVLAKLGARVTTETPLALSGNTGYTTEPHLHFAVFTLSSGSISQSLPIAFASGTGDAYTPEQGDLD